MLCYISVSKCLVDLWGSKSIAKTCYLFRPIPFNIRDYIFAGCHLDFDTQRWQTLNDTVFPITQAYQFQPWATDILYIWPIRKSRDYVYSIWRSCWGISTDVILLSHELHKQFCCWRFCLGMIIVLCESTRSVNSSPLDKMAAISTDDIFNCI